MKRTTIALALCLVFAASADAGGGHRHAAAPNPRIDMQGFLDDAHAAAVHRESRRVTEREFIDMSREPGTIVLDARSRDRYDLLHVDLPFTDITVASLAEHLPNEDTRILIYCNNNFRGEERAFPTKRRDASLNLSTYVALYSYGYRNVYELAPLIDASASELRLVASH